MQVKGQGHLPVMQKTCLINKNKTLGPIALTLCNSVDMSRFSGHQVKGQGHINTESLSDR